MNGGQQPDFVRYLIAVHGIGDQRKNETVLDVINRLAEVRRGFAKSRKSDPLTLGMLSGQTKNINPQTGRPLPWIEFDGIPCLPSAGKLPPFIGRPAAGGHGGNIRFVDVCWADVMRGQFPEVGEDVPAWTSSLIERLKNNPQCPRWVLRLLTVLRRAVLLVHIIMLVKFPILAIKIFNDFLGDVQLYGEYGPCRGQGVRRFHDIMAAVQAAHNLEQEERKRGGKEAKEAHYTIIAHSLGTIMSLDALLYACADPKRGSDKGPHFPGYLKEHETQDPLDSTKRWINNVDSLVTLGSPIDKYLVVWWLNYEFLTHSSWMVPPRRKGREHKIRHFNYADEQDPVGGELDVAYTAPAVKQLFDKEQDLVFTRYPIPAVAHVGYWRDLALFKEIAHRAIDNVQQKTEPLKTLKPFLLWAYLKSLFINYLVIPLIVWLSISFGLTLAVFADSWHTTLVSIAFFIVTLCVGALLFLFIIDGRQVVISKRRRVSWVRLATLILPFIYLLLLAVSGWLSYLNWWPLYECIQEVGWPFNGGELKDCNPQGFILSFLGVCVVFYGLCAYIYFKGRDLRRRESLLFTDYVGAAIQAEEKSVEKLDDLSKV